MKRGDLEAFFAELSSFERMQVTPVIEVVSVSGGEHVLIGTRKGNVQISLPTSRLSIWREIDALKPAWTRMPSWEQDPPIPVPGDPHVGWVELLYDLRYLYPLEDFGVQMSLQRVRRGEKTAQIDLSAGGVRYSFHINLLELMGVSVVIEDCVLKVIKGTVAPIR